ncbi:TniB family NTP-binding protein [Luteibacter sahnii]|uniref:TniB family NTP-binding protein n=1 Tax=Luteibacter sahnii TaxID=3021977 RepID=UPI002A764C21|nr:TniB family NTP-binding protein [Luteibacter sp. PPL193]MDY1550146.1 TniB family NTP-binding protein [Luteibacter sp. PPL193]
MISPEDLGKYKNLVGSIRIDHEAYERIFTSIMDALDDVGTATDIFATAAVPSCKIIVGETRTGKSAVVIDVVRACELDSESGGQRQSIVYAIAPPKGTVKALLEQLLRALGDPHWARGTESNMTQRLLTMLRSVGCRMIIIDEFQHLGENGSGKLLYRTADWLKNLVEGKEWALVAIGLPEAVSIIHANRQLVTRFDPPLVMPLFDWNDDYSRRQFKAVLRSFAVELAPFELPDLGERDTALRLYLATSGRIGLFVKLMDRAVKNAIRKGDPRIRLDDLAVAFEQSIWFSTEFPLPGGPFHADIAVCRGESLIAGVQQLASRDDYDDLSAGVSVHGPKEQPEGSNNGAARSEKRRVKNELGTVL